MKYKISTRDAFGDALVQLGYKNDRIVVFDADVSTCTKSCYFGEKHPGRFFNVGIAEANMVGIAAGFASCGYTCFVCTFAMFAAGRTYDQIRNSIAYPGFDVKIVGTHAGLSVGEDGATHQCLEDLALMRVIPGMTVICPADGHETKEAVNALAELKGPAYLRLGRMELATITDQKDYSFEIGKAVKMLDGKDAAIISTGLMTEKALEAARLLKNKGIDVQLLNMHTIKPMDKEAVLAAAKSTGVIITVEEHSVIGGLGSSVSEIVSESKQPVPVYKIGTLDTFGRSGNAEELLKMYGLTSETIMQKVCEAVANKKS